MGRSLYMPCSKLLAATCGKGSSLRPTALSAYGTSASQTRHHPVVFHPDMRIQPVDEKHRFPMPKDALLYDRLVASGLAGNTFTPSHPDRDTLCLVHDPQYVDQLLDGSISAQQMRRIGLPWSQELVRRTLIGVGSAVLAARLALQYGVACMCNGGTHHAHRAHGSGWCIFNDQAVAARAAQRDAGVERVLFVDLDVHQGDGTAAIFESDPTVVTFSMHCRDQGFPRDLQRSSLDIPLPAGTGDDEYMGILEGTLPMLIHEHQPDLIMYNAGVDVHADDSLGHLNLSLDGIARRDMFVLSCAADTQTPIACAIGGGYSPDHSSIVDRHMILHQTAAQLMPRFRAGRDAKLAARVRRRTQPAA